jgi:hypothetical protein
MAVGKLGALFAKLVGEYGDDAARLVANYGDDVARGVANYGDDAARIIANNADDVAKSSHILGKAPLMRNGHSGSVEHTTRIFPLEDSYSSTYLDPRYYSTDPNYEIPDIVEAWGDEYIKHPTSFVKGFPIKYTYTPASTVWGGEDPAFSDFYQHIPKSKPPMYAGHKNKKTGNTLSELLGFKPKLYHRDDDDLPF